MLCRLTKRGFESLNIPRIARSPASTRAFHQQPTTRPPAITMADAKDEETAATTAMTTYVDGHVAHISALRNHAKPQHRLDLSNDTKLESVVVLPEKEDTPERLKVARPRMRMFSSRKLGRKIADKKSSKS